MKTGAKGRRVNLVEIKDSISINIAKNIPS